MGNTCYVNASIQAMRSVINVVCPATEDDGPLLRALRRFVDARDEAGAAAFLDVVGEALGRDLRTPSDSAEFLQDLVSLLALENGAVERAFQSAWVPVSAALLCSTCGAESPAPEVTVGAEACAKEYVLTVPAVPDSRNVTLSEALPLLEAQHTLALTHAAGSEPVCPKCGAVSSNTTATNPQSLLATNTHTLFFLHVQNCCKVNVRRRLEPAEVLVLNFANPFATTVSPALQQSLLGETYALVSITGFKDGHYTALVNSGYVKKNNAQCLLLSLLSLFRIAFDRGGGCATIGTQETTASGRTSRGPTQQWRSSSAPSR